MFRGPPIAAKISSDTAKGDGGRVRDSVHQARGQSTCHGFSLRPFLSAPPESAVGEYTPQQALAQMADGVHTGSLIVSRGDCLAVKIYSASSYTHVAAVVVHDGETVVYEATGGAGVRKQSLRDYFTSQADHTLHFFHPNQPLSEKRAESFERHLECQLGRPYAIHHHLTGSGPRACIVLNT